MSSSSSILPQTLQSITSIKLRELRKQREVFESRKKNILQDVKNAVDEQTKVRVLLSGLARMHTSNAEKPLEEFGDWELGDGLGELSLTNVRRFLDQSKYDPSIPDSLLDEFEHELHQNLDRRQRKLDYADLYARLLTEWLSSDASSHVDISMPENDITDSAFEVVETQKTRLLQLSEKFESVVFTPLDVNVADIENLLNGLFSGEERTKALDLLRERHKTFGDSFAATTKPFDLDVLRWCIKGLLQSDLLSDQKKNTLGDFLHDEVVLIEIGDVLNMRFADLEGWIWDAEGGIPVEPRRQLNGKYRVVMDEDILQSIFLHFISMSWSVEFKSSLQGVIANGLAWKRPQEMPQDEVERQEYYLGKRAVQPMNGRAWQQQSTYEKYFFMCQLPSDLTAGVADYHDDDGGMKPSNIKQELLRTLGTEVIIRRSLYGEVAVVQSDLQWFATSTSHLTVVTILKFFGVSQMWVSFFQRYLEAPLRMVGLEGSSAEVRIRKRGVPIGHVFQKLFGELIIFAMDLAVNQEAEMLLYRLHDDLWLFGEPEKCVKAWKVMERCARILGVEFNESKTGSVCLSPDSPKKDQILAGLPKGKVAVGFLELDAKTGGWIIDQKQVDAHIQQLRKQLAGCKSVFSWIQTWNSCIGRFFNYTFGQPANCFGRKHVDMILETHRRMQQVLFADGSAAGSSVTEYLKNLITKRFGVGDVPDAFLYFPEELGGLGLRNPFISFLVVREELCKSPEERIADFLTKEKHDYKRYKKEFDALGTLGRKRRMKEIWGASVDIDKSIERSTDFMTMDEYTLYRETASWRLLSAYKELLGTPYSNDVQASRAVTHSLGKLALAQPNLGWSQLSSDQRWIIQLYSAGVIQKFGGLNIVDKGLLPMGVMTMLRARKVTWQTVL